MSTDLLERPRTRPTTGSPRVSHIVKPKGKKTGAALVTEARVFGLEVEALCGHRFVPQHDPNSYPPCSGCVEQWQGRFGGDQNVPDGA